MIEPAVSPTVTLTKTGSFPFFSTDWVDVANDLFSKCHLNLRLTRLTDCDANVFVALYENILGEKVPGNCVVQANDQLVK